jgi:1-aminocyclopropane-1-carboxylate deaminase
MQKITLQRLTGLSPQGIETDILRLDQLHPVVSGNKWFKLKYYLQDALDTGCTTVCTFGGAYSNHIVAVAYAASAAGLKSLGYIRGDASGSPSPTLLQAASFGMELRYLSREQYNHKAGLVNNSADKNIYWINEGGYGALGAKGAAGILELVPAGLHTHILCAVGTGTMMAGLVKAAEPGQQVIGISVLKNHQGLEKEVRELLDPAEAAKPFRILHDYHFGGYAKHPPALIDYMNLLWKTESLPTDIVYTSKLLFAAQDLVTKNDFPAGSRVLLIHSGGLQGNVSLPAGTLLF